MNRLIILGIFLFMTIGLNCDLNTPQDTSSNTLDNWNTIRSDWTDSETYSSDSAQASDAYQYLQDSSTGNAVYTADHFQIILQSVDENSDGTQTWTYAVTKIADGRDFKDLSHLAIMMPNCDGSNITDLGGGSYGLDSSSLSCSDQEGVKWDRSVGANETVTFSFTVDQVYGTGDVTGLVKYGTSCNTVTLPGPDCSAVVIVDPPDDGGTGDDNGDGGGDDGTTSDNCPDWIDTLSLSATTEYKNFHGLNNLGFPIYYVGETMHSDLTICNSTPFDATGLTVTTIVEKYPNGGLACGEPVQTWTGVTVAANDCLVLDHSFHLARSCPWGNYESHLVITREADSSCPVSALIMANGIVGYFDP